MSEIAPSRVLTLFTAEEIQAIAESWIVDAAPHLRLLAKRLRGIALLPKDIQLWPEPRFCICRCAVPRRMCDAEAKSWSRRIAALLRELGHEVRTRDVVVAWSNPNFLAAVFPPTLDEPAGRLAIDLDTGVERAVEWGDSDPDGWPP